MWDRGIGTGKGLFLDLNGFFLYLNGFGHEDMDRGAGGFPRGSARDASKIVEGSLFTKPVFPHQRPQRQPSQRPGELRRGEIGAAPGRQRQLLDQTQCTGHVAGQSSRCGDVCAGEDVRPRRIQVHRGIEYRLWDQWNGYQGLDSESCGGASVPGPAALQGGVAHEHKFTAANRRAGRPVVEGSLRLIRGTRWCAARGKGKGLRGPEQGDAQLIPRPGPPISSTNSLTASPRKAPTSGSLRCSSQKEAWAPAGRL